MAFVQILAQLLKDAVLGKRIVPIVADEARTFGMQTLFRQVGIYSAMGQLYEPEDHDELLYYREAKDGQILEEGINEAGALSSWIAAATSYSAHGTPMLPFYAFYSMFGFQRVGDLIWAAADSRSRGFLIGATAGRTTLAGEGLQHQDGTSHLLASTIQNCVAYDPCFAYELAVILQDGMRRMLQEQEDVFYYVTVMNENYAQPPLPSGAEEGIKRGMYLLRPSPLGDATAAAGKKIARVQLLGAGTILREALAAAEILEQEYDIAADVWSVTSFTELRRDGLECERWNAEHPGRSAQELGGAMPRGDARPGRRRDRLCARGARSDPRLGAGQVPDPGYRRLRPQRHARRAEAFFGVDAQGIARAAVRVAASPAG